jgi:2-octaprenyl-6-methoxyphenol hydroxylase
MMASTAMRGQSGPAKPDIAADIGIVGGGMVGMTLACALGAAGVRVALIERLPVEVRTDIAFDGRSSAIAAGSKAVLDAIGAWCGMAGEAQPILDIRISDGDSPLFLHYDHEAAGAGPMGWIVENRHIRNALIRRMQALPAVTVIEGALTALDRGPGGAVVETTAGTRLRAPLFVATDGRRSSLRGLAGIGVTEWRYPQTGIVCTVAHEHDHDGVAQEHFLPAGPFAILPMTGRRSSIVWTERTALADRILGLDDDGFAAELGLRFGDYLGRLAVVGPRFSYPLALSHAERYIAPRAALAGDAAHAIHPIAGQGLNIGLRDVAALAEVAVDALRLGLDPGSTAVLERYERWRRFDNSLMLAATDGLNRLFSNDAAPVRLARDLGLAAVGRLQPLKRLFMRHAMGLLGDMPRLVRGEAL